MTAPLFRLPRLERLEAARKWVGATVELTVGRHPDPTTWERYELVEVVAVAVPLTGTVADHIIIRRADGGTWTLERHASARQDGRVQTDTLAVSLADVRAIRLGG